jgi:YD repeat-containing protein
MSKTGQVEHCPAKETTDVRTAAIASVIAFVLALSGTMFAQGSITLQHFYDDAGQHTKVVDSAGNVVEYVYDPAGNIVQGNRTTVAPGVLATFNFTPQRGAVGTAVTILGQNFSTTPSSNIVQFTGVNAAVVSANATTLVVLVPTGATTGALTVTVGTFTVTTAPPTETPPAVTITSPAAGATLVSGQAVTVSVSVTSPNAISAVDFAVNGYWFAPGVALAPYTHTFIVPYGVSSLSFGARVPTR